MEYQQVHLLVGVHVELAYYSVLIEVTGMFVLRCLS